jgi:uncharacterized delta-60 repeat protein
MANTKVRVKAGPIEPLFVPELLNSTGDRYFDFIQNRIDFNFEDYAPSYEDLFTWGKYYGKTSGEDCEYANRLQQWSHESYMSNLWQSSRLRRREYSGLESTPGNAFIGDYRQYRGGDLPIPPSLKGGVYGTEPFRVQRLLSMPSFNECTRIAPVLDENYIHKNIVVDLPKASLYGSFDPRIGFDTDGDPSWTDSIQYSFVQQPDDKIIVVGNFKHYNGKDLGSGMITRINLDGSIDPTFTNIPVESYSSTNELYSIALQSDGKILVGGDFVLSSGMKSLMRLNSDGSIDTTFNHSIESNFIIRTIKVLSDGKILVAGTGMSVLNSDGNSEVFNGFLKLNSDGSIDTQYSDFLDNGSLLGDVFSFDVQSDGKIIAGGWNTIARYNIDGTQDTTFYPNITTSYYNSPCIGSIKIQSDGKILIGGNFEGGDYLNYGREYKYLARLNSDGTFDPTFLRGYNNAGEKLGIRAAAASEPFSIKIKIVNDKIFVTGEITYSDVNDQESLRILLLNSDGSRVSTFPQMDWSQWSYGNNSPKMNLDKLNDASYLSNGKILIVGRIYEDYQNANWATDYDANVPGRAGGIMMVDPTTTVPTIVNDPIIQEIERDRIEGLAFFNGGYNINGVTRRDFMNYVLGEPETLEGNEYQLLDLSLFESMKTKYERFLTKEEYYVSFWEMEDMPHVNLWRMNGGNGDPYNDSYLNSVLEKLNGRSFAQYYQCNDLTILNSIQRRDQLPEIGNPGEYVYIEEDGGSYIWDPNTSTWVYDNFIEYILEIVHNMSNYKFTRVREHGDSSKAFTWTGKYLPSFFIQRALETI